MNINALVNMLIQQNPEIANNPQAKEYLQVIQNGDSKRGEEIANNLCKNFGVSKDDAISQAKKFFGM